MKKITKILSVFKFFMILGTNLFSQTGAVNGADIDAVINNKPAFSRGVNLTTWFEAFTPGLPNLRLYDKQDFEYLKAMGVDVIRLPIHFDNLLEDDGSNKIKEIVFEYLDKACDWAEELGIYLVIDNHSFNGISKYPSSKIVLEHLQNVWPQITERYKNRSNYIIFEILNEPVFGNNEWLPIQSKIIELIRSIDKKHTIVVTGAEWGGIDTMTAIKPYEDKNIIYSFHFYEPFIFTHQGASWSSKEVEYLENIPFPYDKNRIPKLKPGARGTWVENSLKTTYKFDGTEQGLRKRLQKVIDYSEKNQVPVWCGEMGAYNLTSQPEDRGNWYETVGKILLEDKIAFTVWGFHGGFGLFKKNSAGIYPDDLEPEVVKSVGLVIPKDFEVIREDFKSPFSIYDDFPGKRISINYWGCKKGTFDCKKEPYDDKYCIEIQKMDRYGAIHFDLDELDFTKINKHIKEAYIEFAIKYTDKNQKLQLRFVDFEDMACEELPWRNSYNLKNPSDKVGEWIEMKIPLTEFGETGAWSNTESKWYNPNNSFDWNKVKSLEFVAEYGPIEGSFFVDDISLIFKIDE